MMLGLNTIKKVVSAWNTVGVGFKESNGLFQLMNAIKDRDNQIAILTVENGGTNGLPQL